MLIRQIVYQLKNTHLFLKDVIHTIHMKAMPVVKPIIGVEKMKVNVHMMMSAQTTWYV